MAKPKYTWLKDYTPPIYRQKSVSLEFFLDYERTILKSQIVFEPNNGKMVDLVLLGENIKLNYLKIGENKIEFDCLTFRKQELLSLIHI